MVNKINDVSNYKCMEYYRIWEHIFTYTVSEFDSKDSVHPSYRLSTSQHESVP